jgi:D-3-phosphoglycerate dehydrogenase / 2-oxoglutarate reductase
MTDRPGPLRALLLENIHATAAEALTTAGFEVERVARALEGDELLERLDGVHVLGIRSGTQVRADVFDRAPELRAVGAFCIGTNQIDLKTATAHGVAVFNAPFSNTRSVVELAIAEIISLTRRMTVHDANMHAGVWEKSAKGSHELRGRSLGIIGYGNIGSQLSVLAEALGMRVFFYDTADKLALGNAQRCSTLDELLGASDVVSLHVDGRPGNSGLFGEDLFTRMRPGSIFLNLSRGFVVDQAALRQHIVSGHISGAALDVFPEEPAGAGDPFESELRGLQNVILTPHIAGSTEEAQEDIGTFVAGKLIAYVQAGTTALSVNLPSVQMPLRPGSTRLLVLHRNQPGAMARIDGLLAQHGLNIEQQVLSTTGGVGFAVTDVSGPVRAEVIEELRQMPDTIRVEALLPAAG